MEELLGYIYEVNAAGDPYAPSAHDTAFSEVEDTISDLVGYGLVRGLDGARYGFPGERVWCVTDKGRDCVEESQ
jgi:hypothetical protein